MAPPKNNEGMTYGMTYDHLPLPPKFIITLWLSSSPLSNLHSVKLTESPWKLMVGRRSFPFGKVYFQGLCFREGRHRKKSKENPDHQKCSQVFRCQACKLTSRSTNRAVNSGRKKTESSCSENPDALIASHKYHKMCFGTSFQPKTASNSGDFPSPTWKKEKFHDISDMIVDRK